MNRDNAIAAAIIIAGGGISLNLAFLAIATDNLYGDGGQYVGIGMLVVGGILLFHSLFAKGD